MTPQQTQELKALLCQGCRCGWALFNENYHHNPRSVYRYYNSPCTANPAVIEWVEKQLEIAKGASL